MPNKTKKTSAGRPREFDEHEVLTRAMHAFLRDGFEAASYEKIAQQMGLSKPSIYNTFGDKLALFQRVLNDYSIGARASILESFANQKSLHQAVRNLLQSAAVFYSQPNGPSLGCLLIGTALPASSQYDVVRDILSDFVQSIDRQLEETITAQYSDDAHALGKTPRLLALNVSSLVYTLAIRARMGVSKKRLLAYADELAESHAST